MDRSRRRVAASEGFARRSACSPRTIVQAMFPRNRRAGAGISPGELHLVEEALRRQEDQRDLGRIHEALEQPANEQLLVWDAPNSGLDPHAVPSPYELVILPTASRMLATLPRQRRDAIALATYALRRDSFPSMAEVLCESPDAFRLRLAGYQVLYVVAQASRTVLIVEIARDRQSC